MLLNEEMKKEEFVAVDAINFNEKKPFTEQNLDIKRLQSKYNNVKTNWRNISDRQKNGSGLSPTKLPKWFNIIFGQEPMCK